MQKIISGLTISLASLALAAPTSESKRTDAALPNRAQEFGVAFSVYNGDSKTYYGVNLEQDPSYSPNYVLVGRELTQYPYSTPAFVNGTGSYTTALVFDLTNQTNSADAVYGAFAEELGEAYGAVARIEAVKGKQEFKWAVNQTIDHDRDAAPQNFFACNTTVNGEAVRVLSFGVTNENLSPPTDCAFTDVIQIYNVPGGLSNPAGP